MSASPFAAWLARSGFLVGLALVVPLGFLRPDLGEALRATPLALPLLTATALFASGLGADTRRLRDAALDARAMALALATLYGAAPILAGGLAIVVAPVAAPGAEAAFLEAMLIAAAQAGTIASAPALTVAARGDQGLAIALTIASNVLTVVATPLVLAIALGADVAFPVGDMMGRMALVVLLPVVLGQLVRLGLGERVEAALPALRLASQVIILVFVLVGASAAAGESGASAAVVTGILVVAGLLHGTLLALSWWTSSLLGFDRPARIALLFCSTQKTLPNGIYLWDRFFGTNPYGALAVVAHHVLQLVVDGLLVPRLTRASPQLP